MPERQECAGFVPAGSWRGKCRGSYERTWMAWLNPPEGDEAARPDEGAPARRPKQQMSLAERAAGGDEEAAEALAERKQRAKTKWELKLREAALSRGGWECPDCTWVNVKTDSKCKKCGMAPGPAFFQERQQAAGRGTSPSAAAAPFRSSWS